MGGALFCCLIVSVLFLATQAKSDDPASGIYKRDFRWRDQFQNGGIFKSLANIGMKRMIQTATTDRLQKQILFNQILRRRAGKKLSPRIVRIRPQYGNNRKIRGTKAVVPSFFYMDRHLCTTSLFMHSLVC